MQTSNVFTSIHFPLKGFCPFVSHYWTQGYYYGTSDTRYIAILVLQQ